MKPEKIYTTEELVADGVIHALGIVSSVLAVTALLWFALPRTDVPTGTALVIYCLALVVMFTASAAYHMIPHMHWKPMLKRWDQAAIFFKIAGTYTPLVVLLGSVFANVVLIGVWLAALVGAVGKLVFRKRFDGISLAIYLPLGWASLLLAWPIFKTLPLAASILILAGGVLYTIGVIFHVWEKLKFQNAIWHAFVLAASACHFAAVASASMAAIA
jgi:hemolysin III